MVTVGELRQKGRIAFTSVYDEVSKAWRVALVVENDYGYRLVDELGPFPSMERASEEAESANLAEGVSDRDVALIIASSMRRSRGWAE